jgi:molybdopterin converting factor small subunit
MEVSIEFLGMQRVVTKTHSITMPIKEKTKVNDALEYVRQQYPELPLDKERVLITVNQKIASLDRVLRANDTISFLPFISGG